MTTLTTNDKPAIGDIVVMTGFGDDEFRVTFIDPTRERREVEAVKIRGSAREDRVAFACRWMTPLAPGRWSANSYTVL